MLEKDLVLKRLGRFELLAGIPYAQDIEKGVLLVDIWYKKLKDIGENKFNFFCDRLEENKIRWHILPTLTDFFEEMNRPGRI